MSYCQPSDLSAHALQAYLDAVEAKIPGAIQGHIAAVSGRIDDALRPRYVLPLALVPATIRDIAAIMAAWRVVGNMTSLVQSEGLTANEWLPLQTQYKQALKDLEAIRDGRMDLGLETLGNQAVEAGGIEVKAPRPIFGDEFFRRNY